MMNLKNNIQVVYLVKLLVVGGHGCQSKIFVLSLFVFIFVVVEEVNIGALDSKNDFGISIT